MHVGGAISGRHGRIALALLLVVTVIVAVGAAASAWSRGRDGGFCERFAEDRIDRAATVTGRGDRILVIGDSWSAGRGLADPADSWPSRLAGRVHVDGFSGSGFSRDASPCPHRAYAERVDQALQRAGAKPDLVILQGGLNETDRSARAVRAGVRRVLARLAEHGVAERDVVVLGPVAAPARAGGVPRVDAILADEAERAGVRYLDVSDLQLHYLDDRLHLTRSGHAEFGDVVADALTS